MLSRFAPFLVPVLPALAVAWGRSHGQSFTLYREPKLAGAMTISAMFLALWAWRPQPTAGAHELRAFFLRPPIGLGAVFLLWTTLTGLWSRVPELFLYEWQQHLLFAILWLALVAQARREADTRFHVMVGMVAAGVIVTTVGMVQLSGLLPFLNELLPPIHRQFGVSHPSVMGYKNPAAIAVLSQLFLLMGACSVAQSPVVRYGLGALATVEIGYLATLQSRTAYGAFMVGGLTLLGMTLVSLADRRHLKRRLLIASGAAVLFLLVTGSNSELRERARSASDMVQGGAYLDSDRGTYLLNTVNMVAHHPWGVGLGQWQVHYPVFRQVDRWRAFDTGFQVRRAHSDHVQTLGETGWLGLTLWAAWLAALILAPFRRYLRGDRLGLFISVQLMAVAAAMGSDYVIEIPFLKFQFFLLAALACMGPNRSCVVEAREPVRPLRAQRSALALLVTGWAIAVVVSQQQSLEKHLLSARLIAGYSDLLNGIERNGSVEPEEVRSLRELGDRWDKIQGWSKTAHREHLIRAHLALLAGDPRPARQHIACALDLHPYDPNALRLMADAVPEDRSARWSAAADHIEHQATAGFEGRPPTPPILCRPSS